MAQKKPDFERSLRKPAILSRKRKVTADLVVSSPESPASSSPGSIHSSPDSYNSSSFTSSSDSEVSSGDENKSPNDKISPSLIHQFRGIADSRLPESIASRRLSPFPELDWAEQQELWHSLVLKDLIYQRDYRVLIKHPELEPRMRAILLDWLTEVCEVYQLKRETFYLTVDYIDRYLMAKPNLPKNALQLLGSTALFVACKMEEIYPPKMESFAFVTDGACTVEDILAQELVLIMTLNWNLSPITINCWLTIFLQLAYVDNSENLIGPEQFPRKLFIDMAAVLDLCVLDIESMKYSYCVLVASCVALFISKETAMHVSGLQMTDLTGCMKWMKPFYDLTMEFGGTDLSLFKDKHIDDIYSIQPHTISLAYYDRVMEKKRQAQLETSPSTVLRELTPPHSNKKKRMEI